MAQSEQPIVGDVWSDKYKYEDEKNLDETMVRTINALTKNETKRFRTVAQTCARNREIIPAGRVLAGAGTDKRVTLINCFVLGLIQDSMNTLPDLTIPGKGIMASCADAAFTQQMGGGIGQDFSTVRPRGADVGGHTVSSGIIPFMMMWDSMCATIRSAGARRGAMMGVLSCTHPDILEFIETKQTTGQLTNFNVSILVTDAFMRAVEANEIWSLGFSVPRADDNHDEVVEHMGEWGTERHYVYKTLPARELWDKIIGGTYIYAEPGIIFIDRVNKENNLNYCEDIQCTNPCGEQPLPPHGDCCLGHINLAALVIRPFTKGAMFKKTRFTRAVHVMVRLLDNVLDVTRYPLPEQAEEAKNKRRIGLGYTGLASALQQLGIAYGSEEAIAFTNNVTRDMAEEAYKASAQLAKERGPFPLYNEKAILCSPFVQKLSRAVTVEIEEHGLRNGVLMSIAPTGTTSLVLGNVSSGVEPVFAHKYNRKMRDEEGNLSREYAVYDYGYLLYCQKHNLDPDDPGNCADIALPDYFVTAESLTVEQHLQMAAAAQEWIDAALSKTINCPTSMSLDEFKEVYARAYELGMKGCTTYRPDPRSGRGAILFTTTETFEAKKNIVVKVRDKVHRPTVVEGRTYKIKWPQEDCAYYVTINDYMNDDGDRRPLEMFISTKSARHDEWVKALCLMITAIFRRAGDPTFIVEELRQVFSPTGGAWEGPEGAKKQYLPSLVAAISNRIEEHFVHLGMLDGGIVDDDLGLPPEVETTEQLDACSKCGARAVIYEEGCATCRACGHSDCG